MASDSSLKAKLAHWLVVHDLPRGTVTPILALLYFFVVELWARTGRTGEMHNAAC